ncbi:MAG: hypothetical protein GC155_10385 [Alphaproteobacteria bacterium]|nr:hypothetical protein [Alphaproteobacteria bacterium]
MAIWVSSLAMAPKLAATHKPARIVSLLSPYDTFPDFAGFGPDRHLRVPIHDIAQDIGDWRAPDLSDAESLIAFVDTWDSQTPILFHCWAGISRSSASAFITACLHNPGADEEEIAWAIRDASPTASPNPRLIAHADAVMGRNGRMEAAIQAIGRGEIADEARPFSISPTFGARQQP